MSRGLRIGPGRADRSPGCSIIVVGNLVWRVYMEIVTLSFRIKEGTQQVERNTRR